MATANYYVTVGDGHVLGQHSNWNTARDLTTGNSTDYTYTDMDIRVGKNATGIYRIWRCFLPIDTSTLPAGANVSSANLHIYVATWDCQDDDGDDYITVVQGSQENSNQLTTADFDAAGNTEGIDSGQRLHILNLNGIWKTIQLNSTGLGWITKGGITKLALKEMHDVGNNAYAGANNTDNYIRVGTYENTTYKAYLTVDYTTQDYIQLTWTK